MPSHYSDLIGALTMSKSYTFDESNYGRPDGTFWGLRDTDTNRSTRIKISLDAGEDYAKWVADALNALKDIPDPAAFVAVVRELADDVSEGRIMATLVSAGRLAAMLKGAKDE